VKGPVLAGLLCVAGAFLVLVGLGNPWTVVEVVGSPLLPERQVDVAGSELAPGLRALGLVGLAGVPALAASRGRGRTVVGLLLLLAGAAVVTGVLGLRVGDGFDERVLSTDSVREAGGAEGEAFDRTSWPYVTAFGGLLLALAGLQAAVKGRRWSGLGRRYDAPTAAPPPAGERDLWEALDRGEDPTGPQDPPSSGAQPRD
jgi:uncharacterized membrane protein (TIGR02234 family)